MNLLQQPKKINNYSIPEGVSKFAYDGCHKIYIIETDEDEEQAIAAGYDICSIRALEVVFNTSCPLRFINTWKLAPIVLQGEDANFIY